ncbi:hypothetical protein XaraCFBP7407_16710 [Xanthomonas arboricola pv. arracaciae]|nr:hypothetical protein XaraCFBP7407_16710 [Xanthomonas arboricola pv. arracaciae]
MAASLLSTERVLSDMDVLDWHTRRGRSLDTRWHLTLHPLKVSRARGNPDGSFQLQTISQEGDQLTVLRLHEFTSAELLFETQLQVLSRQDAVEVFVSLSAQSTGSAVAPQIVSAKCPRIVREILQQWPAWSFSGQTVPNGLTLATGELDGMRLADNIQNASRVHPIVVSLSGGVNSLRIAISNGKGQLTEMRVR